MKNKQDLSNHFVYNLGKVRGNRRNLVEGTHEARRGVDAVGEVSGCCSGKDVSVQLLW